MGLCFGPGWDPLKGRVAAVMVQGREGCRVNGVRLHTACGLWAGHACFISTILFPHVQKDPTQAPL